MFFPMTPLLHISFPEIRLAVRDAHKLRGYFGRVFEQHSSLLHNHLEDGRTRYAYPLVQYKVLEGSPRLIGLGEGAQALLDLFLQIQEIEVGEQRFSVRNKRVEASSFEPALSPLWQTYRFETLWMALNQENYRLYGQYPPAQRLDQLEGIACRNIQAFYKACGVFLPPEQRIRVRLEVMPRSTRFKNQPMTAFSGQLHTNALLPDYIGLGKSVARGFGTLRRLGPPPGS